MTHCPSAFIILLTLSVPPSPITPQRKIDSKSYFSEGFLRLCSSTSSPSPPTPAIFTSSRDRRPPPPFAPRPPPTRVRAVSAHPLHSRGSTSRCKLHHCSLTGMWDFTRAWAFLSFFLFFFFFSISSFKRCRFVISILDLVLLEEEGFVSFMNLSELKVKHWFLLLWMGNSNWETKRK